jgi:hypothetical protein
MRQATTPDSPAWSGAFDAAQSAKPGVLMGKNQRRAEGVRVTAPECEDTAALERLIEQD